MNRPTIELPTEALANFCKRWKIHELALFGSATRDDFRPDSDIDLLASFAPDADWSLLDGVLMQRELETLLHRQVDLISKRALQQSANTIRRDAILSSAQIIYPPAEAPYVTR